jgi:hypothetical protein
MTGGKLDAIATELRATAIMGLSGPHTICLSKDALFPALSKGLSQMIGLTSGRYLAQPKYASNNACARETRS